MRLASAGISFVIAPLWLLLRAWSLHRYTAMASFCYSVSDTFLSQLRGLPAGFVQNAALLWQHSDFILATANSAT